MKTTPIKVRRKVTILKNPRPSFVSFVDHGANQEPFNVVKRQDGADLMTVKPKKVVKSKTSKKSAPAPEAVHDSAAVYKLTFPKKSFKSAEAVDLWMTENKWEDYEIEKTSKGFTVSSTSITEDDLEDIREVSVDDALGVKSFVGKMKEEDEEEADEDDEQITAKSDDDDDADDEDDEDGDDSDEDDDSEDTTKSDDDEDDEEDEDEGAETVQRNAILDEVVSKYDYYDAYYSSGLTLTEVLKDGSSDGLPPGFDEIMSATRKAIGNAMKAGESTDKGAAIAAIAAEFGDAVTAVNTAWDGIVSATKSKSVKKAHRKFLAGITATEAVEEVVATKTEETVAGIDTKAIAEIVTKAVSDSSAGLAKKLAVMQKTIDKQEEQITTQSETLKKFQKGVPSRKSLVDDDMVEQDEADEDDDDDEKFMNSLSRKNVLGGS